MSEKKATVIRAKADQKTYNRVKIFIRVEDSDNSGSAQIKVQMAGILEPLMGTEFIEALKDALGDIIPARLDDFYFENSKGWPKCLVIPFPGDSTEQ